MADPFEVWRPKVVPRLRANSFAELAAALKNSCTEGLGEDQWAIVGTRARLVLSSVRGESDDVVRSFLADVIESGDFAGVLERLNNPTGTVKTLTAADLGIKVPANVEARIDIGNFEPECLEIPPWKACVCKGKICG